MTIARQKLWSARIWCGQFIHK